MSRTSGRFSRFPAVNRTGSDDRSQDEGDSWPSASDLIEVPNLSVAKLLEWVGDDPDRRAAALEAERSGQQRKTAISALSEE